MSVESDMYFTTGSDEYLHIRSPRDCILFTQVAHIIRFLKVCCWGRHRAPQARHLTKLISYCTSIRARATSLTHLQLVLEAKRQVSLVDQQDRLPVDYALLVSALSVAFLVIWIGQGLESGLGLGSWIGTGFMASYLITLLALLEPHVGHTIFHSPILYPTCVLYTSCIGRSDRSRILKRVLLYVLNLST